MIAKKKSKPEMKQTAIRMPMDLWHFINEYAFKNNMSVNSLMVEQLKKLQNAKKSIA
jgi:hypothetical protein